MASAHAAAANTPAAQSSAMPHGDGSVLKELSEAEQRILANMKTASALLQSIHGKLTNSQDSQSSVQNTPEELTKEYIEGVQVLP
jgi:hypothetical protein